MPRHRIALIAAAAAVLVLALAAGCGKGNKSTNPAVGPLEMNSGNIAGSGGVYAHRFFLAGAYPYHCSIHSSMRAMVVVASSAPAQDSLQAVDISGTNFNTATVTIPIGGKVTWTNNDPFAHTVTSD